MNLLKISLRVRCSILKRLVILLGAYELLALAIGSYLLGAQDFQNSLIFYVSMIVSYIVSYELSFVLQHYIIRLELERINKR